VSGDGYAPQLPENLSGVRFNRLVMLVAGLPTDAVRRSVSISLSLNRFIAAPLGEKAGRE
jgi:hypothetical protein